MMMDPSEIRQWAENHRAAAQRERQEMRRNRLSPDASFASALALLNLDESIHGSPFERVDPVTEREDLQMWDAWTKLRARWPDGR
jgi:hypothetical protein